MKQIKPEELKDNPFKLIDKDWMLITAEKEGRTNMMTASWGGLAYSGEKMLQPFISVNPALQKTLLMMVIFFTLCVLGEEYRKQLAYLGKASGRNEDKVAGSGLTVEHTDSSAGKVPYFTESRLVLVCKKLYAQKMDAACFTKYGKDIPAQMYSDNDWHTIYVAEIEKVLEK